MKTRVLVVFVCLLASCSARDKDYASVPASVPEEAKPVWLMIKACETGDLTLFKKVVTPETVQAMEKRGGLEGSFRRQQMNYMTTGVTTANVRFTVSNKNAELFKQLGVGENASLKPRFAFVEMRGPRNVAGILVRKVGSIWQVDANQDRPLKEVIEPGAPTAK